MKKTILIFFASLLIFSTSYSQSLNDGRAPNVTSGENVSKNIIQPDSLVPAPEVFNGSDFDEDLPPMLKSAESSIYYFDNDVIIQGSLGVGLDMPNGHSFGYNTFVLKENNLRIYFDDTSNSESFPKNDWCLVANDSNNGGKEYFAIQDATASRNLFLVEAGAPANALYIEDNGDVGFGTSTPVEDVQIRDGWTPTLRLELDESEGWPAQNWDIGGNETNFFIRDATNGSRLPFRIQPGTPKNTLTLKQGGKVGIGTWEPKAELDVCGNIKVDSVIRYNPINISKVSELEGTMVMDSASHKMMYYNGSEWISLKNAEKQEISLANNMLSISGSTKKVSLTSFLDNTDDQRLKLLNNTLSIEGGNSVSLSPYLNTDDQEISLTDNTLQISRSSSVVDLAKYIDNTDAQEISLSNDLLTISGSEVSVDLSLYLDNTDAQEISLNDNVLKITGSESSIDLVGYMDNTDNQEILLSDNLLTITGSGASVDLSGFQDNTDEQLLALDGNTLSISGGNSVDLSSLLEEQQNQIVELNMQVETLSEELAELKELMEIVAETVGAKVMAKSCSIEQNTPNPFSGSTVIKYKVNEFIKDAYIAFYTRNGHMVKTVPINKRGEGFVTFRIESSSQIYLYALFVDGVKVETKKMVYLR